MINVCILLLLCISFLLSSFNLFIMGWIQYCYSFFVILVFRTQSCCMHAMQYNRLNVC